MLIPARPRHDLHLVGLLCIVICSLPGLYSAASPVKATVQRAAYVRATHPAGAMGSLATNSQIYFAEGSTSHGPSVSFGETLNMLNTSPLTATGQITYFSPAGMLATVPITIAARTRLSEDVVHDVGYNSAVSALIAIDQSITASRSISRTTVQGTSLQDSTSNGVTAPSPFWYFAEGYTGVSFQEYIAVVNPGSVTANVLIQPVTLSGSGPAAPISQVVAAHSRATINLRALLPNLSLGLVVQSDQPVVAERILYWGNGQGSAKYGAAATPGLLSPSSRWSFPFVSVASGDQTFLSFTDPTMVAAHVQFTVYDASGIIDALPDLTVDPGSQSTMIIPVHYATSGAIAVVANSDVPVVGEEAQYFGGSPNVDEHAGSIVAGVAQPGQQWDFPGANESNYTGGGWYILNTGSTTAQLSASFFGAYGLSYSAHYVATPGQLTRVGLESLPSAETGFSSSWTSTAPVVMIQLWRNDAGSAGTLIAGITGNQQ